MISYPPNIPPSSITVVPQPSFTMIYSRGPNTTLSYLLLPPSSMIVVPPPMNPLLFIITSYRGPNTILILIDTSSIFNNCSSSHTPSPPIIHDYLFPRPKNYIKTYRTSTSFFNNCGVSPSKTIISCDNLLLPPSKYYTYQS